MNNIQQLVESLDFFKASNIQVINENTNDLNPECYQVSNLDTGTQYKIRLAKLEYDNSVDREVQNLESLYEYGISGIPKIYYNGFHKDWKVLIYEYFKGASLEKIPNLTQSDYKKISNQIISSIKEYRTIKSETAQLFEKSYTDWYDLFSNKLSEHLDHPISQQLISRTHINQIRNLLKLVQSDLRQIQNCFIHYDIKPKNIVYDGEGGLTYLIDFELSRFGDPLMELARIKSFAPTMEYEQMLVDPILEAFEYEKCQIGKNTFTLYLLYCYIVYHKHNCKAATRSNDPFFKQQSHLWFHKIINTLSDIY